MGNLIWFWHAYWGIHCCCIHKPCPPSPTNPIADTQLMFLFPPARLLHLQLIVSDLKGPGRDTISDPFLTPSNLNIWKWGRTKIKHFKNTIKCRGLKLTLLSQVLILLLGIQSLYDLKPIYPCMWSNTTSLHAYHPLTESDRTHSIYRLCGQGVSSKQKSLSPFFHTYIWPAHSSRTSSNFTKSIDASVAGSVCRFPSQQSPPLSIFPQNPNFL